MAELTVTFPGTLPSSWWAQDPADVLTVVAVMEARAR